MTDIIIIWLHTAETMYMSDKLN